jgi:hypothetical protein
MPAYESVCLPPDGGGVALQQESFYEARQDTATQRLPVHPAAHLNQWIRYRVGPEHVGCEFIIVLGIRDILVRIWILGSYPWLADPDADPGGQKTYGPGCGFFKDPG